MTRGGAAAGGGASSVSPCCSYAGSPPSFTPSLLHYPPAARHGHTPRQDGARRGGRGRCGVPHRAGRCVRSGRPAQHLCTCVRAGVGRCWAGFCKGSALLQGHTVFDCCHCCACCDRCCCCCCCCCCCSLTSCCCVPLLILSLAPACKAPPSPPPSSRTHHAHADEHPQESQQHKMARELGGGDVDKVRAMFLCLNFSEIHSLKVF